MKYSLNLLWLPTLITKNSRCEWLPKFLTSTQICFLYGPFRFPFSPEASVFAEHLFYLVARFNLQCQMKMEELSISRGQREATTSSKGEGWQTSAAGPGRWCRTEPWPASASKGCSWWNFHTEPASTWNSCNIIFEDGLCLSSTVAHLFWRTEERCHKEGEGGQQQFKALSLTGQTAIRTLVSTDSGEGMLINITQYSMLTEGNHT